MIVATTLQYFFPLEPKNLRWTEIMLSNKRLWKDIKKCFSGEGQKVINLSPHWRIYFSKAELKTCVSGDTWANGMGLALALEVVLTMRSGLRPARSSGPAEDDLVKNVIFRVLTWKTNTKCFLREKLIKTRPTHPCKYSSCVSAEAFPIFCHCHSYIFHYKLRVCVDVFMPYLTRLDISEAESMLISGTLLGGAVVLEFNVGRAYLLLLPHHHLLLTGSV